MADARLLQCMMAYIQVLITSKLSVRSLHRLCVNRDKLKPFTLVKRYVLLLEQHSLLIFLGKQRFSNLPICQWKDKGIMAPIPSMAVSSRYLKDT